MAMRVAYVCDGGGRIGWGHVMRGWALLAALPGGTGTLVVGRGYRDVSAKLGQVSGAPAVEPWLDAHTPFDCSHRRADLVFADDYELSDDWIGAVSGVGPTVLVDDWMRSRVLATALLNPNLGASVADYDLAAGSLAMVGPRYALLRAEVGAARGAPRPSVNTDVLITFGGSDPDGQTAVAVEALMVSAWYRAGGRISVVLGASYSGREPWAGWDRARAAGVDVVVDPANFLARCRAARLVVCGASTTSYEMACLGAPFVPVVLVANQRRVGSAWAAYGGHSVLDARTDGWGAALSRRVSELFASRDGERAALAPADLVDGQGAHRVLRACAGLVASGAVDDNLHHGNPE